MKFQTEPPCFACEFGVEAFHADSKRMIKEFGWVAHGVPKNYHTHGLQENFDHPDIQIVFPMPPHICHPLANIVVELIKGGKKFTEGDINFDILAGDFPVRFIKAKECGRDILRMILPDKQGKLLPEEISPPYDCQYLNLETN